MRKVVLFGFLFLSIVVKAQLYVSSGSYVYAQDQYITVTQDVNLASNSNIYLRDEAQVLQRTTSTSTNSGQGHLSLFQEGTVNNFQYNYWCSPVGAADGSTGNSSFSITQFHRPTGLITSNPAVMLSNTALDGLAANLSIAPRWVFRFLSSTSYSQWLVTRTNPIQPGEGFTMKGTQGTDTGVSIFGVQNNPGSAQRYDFRGKPNDGNIPIVVGAGQKTLTGNPYPSAIWLRAFLIDPAHDGIITSTAYFWEHNKSINSHFLNQYEGGYGTYNGTSNVYLPAPFHTTTDGDNVFLTGNFGNPYEREFTPVGQGFMVEGSGGGTVFMRNSYRVFRREGAANQSQFERTVITESGAADYGYYDDIPNVAGIDFTQISKAPTPHILFNVLLQGTAVKQIASVFMESAIDGLDMADSKSPSAGSNAPLDSYFVINDMEYVQYATNFDIHKRIPIGFRNNVPNTFKIQVGEFVNFNQAENVYLHDKVTGQYHNILDQLYELNLAPGIYHDRFEITFINETLNLPNLSDNEFQVVQNNATHTMTLHNPKSMDIKTATLYDITGKKVIEKLNIGNDISFDISTKGLSDAVYVLKVTAEGYNDFGIKIPIKNN
ncbi:MAG: T9SS type A sorting domain-containing protein [Flavobacterium sp.]